MRTNNRRFPEIADRLRLRLAGLSMGRLLSFVTGSRPSSSAGTADAAKAEREGPFLYFGAPPTYPELERDMQRRQAEQRLQVLHLVILMGIGGR